MHLAPINWPFFHVKVERVKGQSSSMAWWWTSCGRHRCIYVYGGRFMVTMVTIPLQLWPNLAVNHNFGLVVTIETYDYGSHRYWWMYVYEKLHTGSETVKGSCCNTLHKVTFSSSKLKKVKGQRSRLCAGLIMTFGVWFLVTMVIALVQCGFQS